MDMASFNCFAFSLISIVYFYPNVNGDERVDLDTLQLTQIIMVSGEHTPVKPYPSNSSLSNSIWPLGWGQLTEEGKRSQYSLGEYLRRRYGGFICSNYLPHEIYALSSETDRAIASASLCLAGMYPSDNGTLANLNWQPVPVRTVPKQYDNILEMTKGCTRFEIGLQDFLKDSPPMKRINQENKAIFDYLTATSGISVNDIGGLQDLYQNLLIEDGLGRDIPEWARLVIHTPELEYLYNLSFLVKTMTHELKRLQAGPLIKLLGENVNKKISPCGTETKAFILSGHQKTLVGLMNALGLSSTTAIPPYSTALMLELHKKEEDYFIQILLRNDTRTKPYKLTLPGCKFDCPLNQFLNWAENLIPQDWDKECLHVSRNPFSKLSSTVTAWITGGITFVLNNLATVGMYFVYTFVQKRRNCSKDRSDYEICEGRDVVSSAQQDSHRHPQHATSSR